MLLTHFVIFSESNYTIEEQGIINKKIRLFSVTMALQTSTQIILWIQISWTHFFSLPFLSDPCYWTHKAPLGLSCLVPYSSWYKQFDVKIYLTNVLKLSEHVWGSLCLCTLEHGSGHICKQWYSPGVAYITTLQLISVMQYHTLNSVCQLLIKDLSPSPTKI